MGNELESRVKKLEMIIKRLARRSRKTTTAIITPYPISNAVFDDSINGSVLRYLFPCTGKISKALIIINNKLKEGAFVEITIKDDVHTESKSFIITKKINLKHLDLEVDSGDMLNVSVKSVNEQESITEVWMSFLWIPSIKDVHMKNFLIDNLENESKRLLDERV